jgi:hypothetical protein
VAAAIGRHPDKVPLPPAAATFSSAGPAAPAKRVGVSERSSEAVTAGRARIPENPDPRANAFRYQGKPITTLALADNSAGKPLATAFRHEHTEAGDVFFFSTVGTDGKEGPAQKIVISKFRTDFQAKSSVCPPILLIYGLLFAIAWFARWFWRS